MLREEGGDYATLRASGHRLHRRRRRWRRGRQGWHYPNATAHMQRLHSGVRAHHQGAVHASPTGNSIYAFLLYICTLPFTSASASWFSFPRLRPCRSARTAPCEQLHDLHAVVLHC